MLLHVRCHAFVGAQVCGITCCGLVNFEQHCSSKKHLRRAAAAAGALTGASVVASDSTDTERNTTYVGLQAQCRSYCKQARTAAAHKGSKFACPAVGCGLGHACDSDVSDGDGDHGVPHSCSCCSNVIWEREAPEVGLLP